MLLKISGFVPWTDGQLTADDKYVPLSFSAYESLIAAPYIWQAHGTDRLIECMVDRDSGVLVGVKVVLCSEKKHGLLPGWHDSAARAYGLPTVQNVGFDRPGRDPSLQPFHRHDHHFEMTVAGSDVSISLAATVPSRCFRVDRVGLFAAEEEIVGIGFYSLTDLELANLDRLVPG